MAHLSIRDWNEDDRPREKLISSGAEACSNAELLAILINNGSKGKSAVELARELLDKCDNNLLCLVNKHLQEIQSINGFGPAKACVIKAAAELGRRIRLCNQPNLPVVLSSADVARVMDFLNQVSHEEFWVLFCNVAGKLIDKRMISKGTANKTFVDYKDIVSLAIMLKCWLTTLNLRFVKLLLF